MPFITYRGEKSVTEIVEKMFVRLTKRQQEMAAAALLKANPQLKDPGKVADGTILRVPDIPELRAKIGRNLEHPDAQVAKDISEALTGYGERLTARYKADQTATKDASTLLGTGRFKKAIANVPHLMELADQAGKALQARTKGLDERQKKNANAIKQLLKDLNANIK